MTKIAFYATIKPPDHPIASGDRLIARNLISALELAGYDVELASKFIAYSKREDDTILHERKASALEEAERILETYRYNPPDLWVTYHPYCKAPDWIGPHVSQELGIPYVTVEAAKTGQGFENGGDRWAAWRLEAQNGIKKADLHIAFKEPDVVYLEQLLQTRKTIKQIAPFINTKALMPGLTEGFPENWRPNAPTLVTVGMMRPGKKLKNYQLLREVLEQLQPLHWNLILIGDGPEMNTIKQEFSLFDPSRLFFAGARPHKEVLGFMKAADLFVWPGWKEPIGMVYLEAQFMGLPVAALDSMGVSLSVDHGKTGLLAPEDRLDLFCENLTTLLSHPNLRLDFGEAAKLHITQKHSLQAAADELSKCLDPLIQS